MAEGARPPLVFDQKRQQATYPLWLEHTVLEEAPIEITRRYQAAFAKDVNVSSAVSISAAARRSALIDSDEESSDTDAERSGSGSTDSEAPKMPLKKSRTTAGVVRTPKAKSPSSDKPKRAKRDAYAGADDDEGDYASPPPKKVAKRGSSERPTTKSPKASSAIPSPKTTPTASAKKESTASMVRSSLKHEYSPKVEPSTTPKRSTPKANRADPLYPQVRVYLSQATEDQKTHYKLRLAATMAFETNITKATTVVSFQHRTSPDDPISFNVLYAIAMGKLVVGKTWLDDAIGLKGIPEPFEHRMTDLPGSWKLNELSLLRERYLTARGVRYASEMDPEVPPLLFSQWTFNLDPLKKTFNSTVIAQIRELIMANDGMIGGDAGSDIWLTPDAFQRVPTVSYGEVGAPPEKDVKMMALYPHWRRRKFRDRDTIASFPVYAIPFDFIRDSVATGVCADPTHYPNLMDDLRGLSSKRGPAEN